MDKVKSLFIPETWDDIEKLSEKDIKDVIDNYCKILEYKFYMERLKDGSK